MADVWQKIEIFNAKSYNERLEIAINIINNLKDRWNIQAQEIYEKISHMERVPEGVINAIYLDFCNSIDRIEKERVRDELHKFSKAWTYLTKLREDEKAQREKDDPESLLTSLYEM